MYTYRDCYQLNSQQSVFVEGKMLLFQGGHIICRCSVTCHDMLTSVDINLQIVKTLLHLATDERGDSLFLKSFESIRDFPGDKWHWSTPAAPLSVDSEIWSTFRSYSIPRYITYYLILPCTWILMSESLWRMMSVQHWPVQYRHGSIRWYLHDYQLMA